MHEIIDDLDFGKDEYTYKLEFKTRFGRRAVVALAMIGALQAICDIVSIFVKVYFFLVSHG